ncbi:MAG: hypothetical protein K0R63_872 [Rickettsiales bacterium]|jgi:hypothetical protein|nr:hypothetical protein [Rickettsiales bacterium]
MQYSTIELGHVIDESTESFCGERALWRAVIAQAVLDATSASSKSRDQVERGRAKAWLSGTSSDFLVVCALADLNPHYVIQRTERALKDTRSWRKRVSDKTEYRKKSYIGRRRPLTRTTNSQHISNHSPLPSSASRAMSTHIM